MGGQVVGFYTFPLDEEVGGNGLSAPTPRGPKAGGLELILHVTRRVLRMRIIGEA
jgi:hypothetical protein